MITGSWVVVCELPQWVVSVKPMSVILFEQQRAFLGHHLVNATLIVQSCETRGDALKYLKWIREMPGITIAPPPDGLKPTSQPRHEHS